MLYLHEVIECLPGQTDAYLDFVERVYLPIADQVDVSWLTPAGFWKPRTTYGKWSQAVLLYKVQSWAQWLTYMNQRSKSGNESYFKDFDIPVRKLRSGWFDRVVAALPFSPEPPLRPQIVRTGSMFLNHLINVRPDGIRQFVAAMRDVVIPAAAKQGLRLELFARVVCKPTEYLAIWSVPDVEAMARWREAYDVEAPGPNLPGFDAAWPYITDFEERDLIPSTTSPLGGRDPYPAQGSGVEEGARTSLFSGPGALPSS